MSVTWELLALATPALGALALDPLLSLIDTAFVGRLGVAPLAGVGLATLLLNISFSLFNFLCISITPLVAAALHERGATHGASAASPAISLALQSAALLGVCAAVVLCVAAPPLMPVLGASADVAPFAIAYVCVRACGIPFALMSFVMNGALRAFRDLRTPLLVAVVANLLNITLDILLMFGLGLGVVGAALATSLSQVLACVLMLAHLVRARRLRPRDLGRAPARAGVAALGAAGAMLGVRTLALLGTVAFATASAARQGVVALAAFELCRQLWVFNATLLDSLAAAAQALVASAVAAHRIVRARRVAVYAVRLAVVAASALAVLAVGAGRALPALFVRDDEVCRVAARCIGVMMAAAPINGAVFALDGVFAACSDYAYLARGIAASAALTCMLIWGTRVCGGGVVWIWAALNGLMVARAVVLVARFYARDGPLALSSAEDNGA